MRYGINTTIGNSQNGPFNALDLTIENPELTARRGYNIETRYDVDSISNISEGDNTVVVTLSTGKKFRLGRTAPAGTPAKSDTQVQAMLTPAQELAFMKSTGTYVSGVWFGSFNAFKAHVNKNSGQTGVHPQHGAALTIYRVSPRLQAALGYTPVVAYAVR
jgi:hypothetical protein